MLFISMCLIPTILDAVTAIQAATIFSLISIAENSNTAWCNNYNYIEDIGDGRGYTIGVVGFCTGTSDFLWFTENLCHNINPLHPLCKYLPALRKVDGTSSHTGLSGLPALIKTMGHDQDYIKATWQAIHHFYWDPMVKVSKSLGLKNAVSLGQLFDVNINMGTLSLVHKVTAKTPLNGGSEDVWLAEFQKIWKNQITRVDRSLDDGQPDRANMWISIAKNHALVRPIYVTCYGDRFSIV